MLSPTPSSSLAWELWRKNRLGFLVLFGLLALGIPVRLLSLVLPASDDLLIVFGGNGMLLTFLVLFAIFSFTDSGVQISYPPRTFTLPVSTGLLVHGPILLGALLVAMMHAAWAYLFILPRAPHYPIGAFTLFWIAGLVAFQASIWCLSSSPKLLTTALMLGLIGLVRLASLLLANPESASATHSAMLWLCGILALSYAGAWFGIACQRRGQWHISGHALALVFNRAGGLFKSRGSCATPAGAQLWMEWRRNAAPALLMAGLGSALFLSSLNKFLTGENSIAGVMFDTWLFLFSSAVTLWAAVTGLLLARDPSSNSLALSPFLGARPISSGEIAWAKIKLSIGLTAIGWLIYGLGVSLWFVLGNRRPLRPDEVQVLLLVALGLAWHLIGGLPCWLAGRIPSAVVAGLLVTGGYIALGNDIGFFARHIGLVLGCLQTLLLLGFAAKIFIAGWAFAGCYRRNLLRGRAILAYVFIWSFGTVGFVSIALRFCHAAHIPPSFALLTAVLLLPLARIALSPLAVAAARHR